MTIFFRSVLFIFILCNGWKSYAQLTVEQIISGQSDILLADDNWTSQKRVVADIDKNTKNRVYVWQELDAGSTTNKNIRCAVYSESMSLIQSFIVNVTTTGDQIYPSVKVNQNDNSFVVAWCSWINNTDPNDVNKYDIYAKKISFSNINNDKANADLLINDASLVSGRQIAPLLTFDYSSQEVIIAWIDQDGRDNSTPTVVDYGSYAKRVKTIGATLAVMPIANQFLINVVTLNHQTVTSIEYSSFTGELYTVCQSIGYSIPTSYDVIFRKFTRGNSGNFIGGTESRVNTATSGDQTNGNFVMNSLNGNYAIGWSGTDGSGYGSYFKIYDNANSQLKAETLINQATANNQLVPKGLWEETSNTVVFFYWYSQSGTVNIRYQLFDGYNNFAYLGTETVAESQNLQNYYGALYSLAYEKSTRRLVLSYDQANSSSGVNTKGWMRQFLFVPPCPVVPIASSDQNYVETKKITQQGIINESACSTLTETSSQTTRTYLDGLGRPIQQVVFKGSPSKNDLIQPFEYDNAGRENKKYLPYAAPNCADGTYKTTWASDQAFFYNNTINNNADRIVNDANPYSKNVFDESPLNRIIKGLPQGSAWQGSGTNEHSIKTTTRTNTANEVRNFIFDFTSFTATGTSFYAAGQLNVSIVTDEDNNIVWEYKDNSNTTVLKRRQDLLTNDFLDTYYVYDDFGNLRFVIPPQPTSLLSTVSYTVGYTGTFANLWLFTYKYDERGRVVEKKNPGASVVFSVYDNKDRLVLSQDGNQRASNLWSYIKYDLFGRKLISGIYTHTSALTQSAMQTLFTNNTNTTQNENRQASTNYGYSNTIWPTDATKCEVLEVSYYDDYDFDYNGTDDHSYAVQGLTNEAPVNNYILDKATGSIVKILGSSSDFLKTVQFYDKYYRQVQVLKNNHKNLALMSDLQTTVNDFSGKPVLIKQTHNTGSNPITITKRYDYDHAERLINTWQKNNTDSEVLLSQLIYNELGQNIEKNLHSENSGTSYLQSVDFTYNVRGWLTHINNSTLSNDGITNNDANDIFGLQLCYETAQAGSTPKFNGSITSQRWKGNTTSQTSLENIFRYFYNGMNSLRLADLGTLNGSTWVLNNTFKESNISYDFNGNINTLTRYGNSPSFPMDSLTYTYNGNQLVKVTDAGDNSMGFQDWNNTAIEYTYDNNGSLTSDLNKVITGVIYNYLNLVQEVQFPGTGNKIVFTYSSDGVKLSKKVYGNNVLGSTWDYIGPYVYVNNSLHFISTDEGRVAPNTNGVGYYYEYNIKDHLGSIRMSFIKDPVSGLAKITQEDNYYAFGMKMLSGQYSYIDSDNKLLYSGKEIQEESGLNWYDYGARMYDVALGRWHTVDPMAELSRRWSPYTYCYNNPIKFTDPDGMYAPDNDELQRWLMYNASFPETIGDDTKGKPSGGDSKKANSNKVEEKKNEIPENKPVDWTPFNNFMIEVNEWNPLANLVNGLHGLATGYDINGREMGGIDPGLKIISVAPIGRLAGNTFNAVTKSASQLFKVGAYNTLKGAGGGLTAHHVGQKAVMSKLIAGYNWKTAPSILVPATGHTLGNGVLSRVTTGFTSPRQVLARDIWELRRVYPNIPNSSLQELIQLNKIMYPGAFTK